MKKITKAVRRRKTPGVICIGLTYDLRSDYLALGYSEEQTAEFDAEVTIRGLESAIASNGFKPCRIGNIFSLCERLAGGERWDLVFNIAEGFRGTARESQIPCLLDAYGIPYTMSNPLVNAVTLDKELAKKVVRDAGINTPASRLVGRPDDLCGLEMRFPLFAKPVGEGTGKGVSLTSKIDRPEDLLKTCTDLLKRFGQPVLVEEYLPGREFTVGIIGNGRSARAIGTMEIIFLHDGQERIYSYEVKEFWEEYVKYDFPAPCGYRTEVEAVALDAYRALDCRDCARVDIRYDRDGRPAFIEVNTLPGLNPEHSDLPMIAREAGMSFDHLIGAVIEAAFKRCGLKLEKV